MSRDNLVPLAVIALLAGGGWYFREPLLAVFQQQVARISGPAKEAPVPAVSATEGAAAPAAPHKDTVYRWVDKNGVTHFDQEAGEGRQAVEVDQGRIQSLSSLTPPRHKAAAPARH